MDLKAKVKKGLIWTFCDQILSQIILVIFGIFLARLLSPAVYGVVGMVTIFTSFASIFIDMGFGVALIQKKEADDRYFSSVFWLNLFIGTVLYLLFYVLAPFLADFYEQPELVLLVRVICLSFVIASLTSVQSNLLVRELQFKKKVIFNWISLTIGYTIAFYLASHNYGVWALVWMTLSSTFTNSVLFWIASRWRPKFYFSWEIIRELSRIGLNVLGDTTVNYWSRNYDNFIIAKVLGSTDLGLYTRAYSLMLLPLRNISAVFTKVMFPAFSKIQDDVALIKKHYLQLIKYIAMVTFPLMFGLSMVSKEFVLLFFGEEWKAMIPVLSILSVLGSIQSILSLNGMIYNSLNKAYIAFRVTIVSNVVLIIVFTITVHYGVVGVSWGYFGASLLIFLPMYRIALKQLNAKLTEVFHLLKYILFSVFVMVLVLLAINYFTAFPLWLSFIIKIVLGGSTYIVILFYLEKELFQMIKNTVVTIWKIK